MLTTATFFVVLAAALVEAQKPACVENIAAQRCPCIDIPLRWQFHW